MEIKSSEAKYSAIVKIGEELNRLRKETGKPYLGLNRGVNDVVPIDLSKAVEHIDFNGPDIQVYNANQGNKGLREAIALRYYDQKTTADNILITNGGMNALDLLMKTIDTEVIYAQSFYWGAYRNIGHVNGVTIDAYESFEELIERQEELSGQYVIICDPNNPIGNAHSDVEIQAVIATLTAAGVYVIWDSPYRALFGEFNTPLNEFLCQNDRVIVTESFSKSIGLSGQRIGFVHTLNRDLMHQLNINILYELNGVNGFSQELVRVLFTTDDGAVAVEKFKAVTTQAIADNIAFLEAKGLLAEEFYEEADPRGIFTVVNVDYDTLLEHRIGSVPLAFFTQKHKEAVAGYSRICVSVPHDTFVSFFDTL